MFPSQQNVLAYRSPYGDPRGRNGMPNATWRRANLVAVPVPYKMAMEAIRITRITIHRACADSLARALGGKGISQATESRKPLSNA